MSGLTLAENQPRPWVATQLTGLAVLDATSDLEANKELMLEDDARGQALTNLARGEQVIVDKTLQGLLARFVRIAMREEDDAYEIAAQLLRTFGSLGGVLKASEYDLRRVVVNSEELHFTLTALQSVVVEIAQETLDLRPIFSNNKEVFEYARTRLGHEKTLVCCAIYLDSNMRLIEVEEHSRGTIDVVRFYVRNLIQKALQHNCANVILFRNSLNDIPYMMRLDAELCHKVETALFTFQMSLHDFLIVSRMSFISLRSLGVVGDDK